MSDMGARRGDVAMRVRLPNRQLHPGPPCSEARSDGGAQVRVTKVIGVLLRGFSFPHADRLVTVQMACHCARICEP